MPRTVRLLLTFGADPDATAIEGAPIHVAMGRRENPALFEQLRPYTSGRTKFRNGWFELDPDHGVVIGGPCAVAGRDGVAKPDFLGRMSSRRPDGGVRRHSRVFPAGCAWPSEGHLPPYPTPKYAPFTSEEWDERILNTVTALLEFGADLLALKPSLRSLDCDQQTAMHFAAATNLPAVISLLVSRGVDPPTPDQEVRAAARFAFPKLISTLFARGADPNELNARGWSSLHELLANTDIKREDYVVEPLDVFWKSISNCTGPHTPCSGNGLGRWRC